MPGWEQSKGLTEEIKFAKENNINIQYIEYIDSRIKKYNIAYNMINIYENQY